MRGIIDRESEQIRGESDSWPDPRLDLCINTIIFQGTVLLL